MVTIAIALAHFRADHAAEHTSGHGRASGRTRLGAGRASARVPSLPGDVDADVAIVGAGYTGLWTAYALCTADPSLRVVVCEREHVGFGASGRNGGWCSAFFAGSRDATVRRHGRDAAIAMQRAMFDDARRDRARRRDRGHRLRLGARRQRRTSRRCRRTSRASTRSSRTTVASGSATTTTAMLEPDEARARIGCTPNLGALYTPHCAAIHPAKLVHGLARGGRARAASRSTSARRPSRSTTGRVRTLRGTVRADVVVRATEAFTPDAARPAARARAGLLADDRDRAAARRFWADAGAARARDVHRRPPPRHLRAAHRRRPVRVRRPRRAVSLRLAHAVRSSTRTQTCSTRCSTRCGRCSRRSATRRSRTAGAARSACRATGTRRSASIAATGMAWAGGYVGDGVRTTNLAGRTLADLVLGRDTDLTHLPWVGHRVAAVGARAAALARHQRHAACSSTSLDRAEAEGRDPRRRAAFAARVLGALNAISRSSASGGSRRSTSAA